MQAGTAVKYRKYSVHIPPVPVWKSVPVSVRHPYRCTGHFGKFGATSIPVPDTSVSSILLEAFFLRVEAETVVANPLYHQGEDNDV